MENTKGKIIVKMPLGKYKEITIDEYAEYLDMGDGDFDWDHLGWYMGKSDQDAFDEMLKNTTDPFDVKGLIKYFLEHSKNGLEIEM